MKLSKENFKKNTLGGGTILYTYECEGNKYHIRVMGLGGKDIFVYKNDDFDENYENTFKTTDNLEAWKKFEELVGECQESQESSGGFMRKPQDNPNVLPLLAVKKLNGEYRISVFVVLPDGTQIDWKTIAPEYEFNIPEKSFEKPTNYKTNVFEVDWSGLNLPEIFDGIIIIKYYDKVKFEVDPDAEVFLFIPQNIVNQGGDDGEDEDDSDEDGEPDPDKKKKNKKKGKPDDDGEPDDDEDGEPDSDEDGEPDPDKKKKKKKKGKPDDDGEPDDDEDGEPDDDEDGEPDPDKKKKNKKKGKPDEDGEHDDEDEIVDDEDGQSDDEEKKKGKMAKRDSDDEEKKRKEGDIDDIGERKIPPSSELVRGIAQILNRDERTVKSFFSRVNVGETFLSTNNFSKIKKQLNLPESMTPRQLSETINKQI